MATIRPLLFVLCIFAATYSQAAQTACPEHYAGGQSPDFINQKLTAKTKEVCYSGYGLMHSGITRTPLYSAEHLTRDRLQRSRNMKRKNNYFPDPNIPFYERAELHHYARSGFSRGHIAPSGDMPDEISQQESFSLANMVPQVAENNQGIWERIESAVRGMARSRGELYVVTGPIFQGASLKRIGGAVMVPTQLFKAAYDPNRQEAGAYIVDNTADARPVKVSIAELEKITGMRIFPAVGNKVKSTLMKLPEPKIRKKRKNRGYWSWLTR